MKWWFKEKSIHENWIKNCILFTNVSICWLFNSIGNISCFRILWSSTYFQKEFLENSDDHLNPWRRKSDGFKILHDYWNSSKIPWSSSTLRLKMDSWRILMISCSLMTKQMTAKFSMNIGILVKFRGHLLLYQLKWMLEEFWWPLVGWYQNRWLWNSSRIQTRNPVGKGVDFAFSNLALHFADFISLFFYHNLT